MLSYILTRILLDAKSRLATPGKWIKDCGHAGQRVCLGVAVDEARGYLCMGMIEGFNYQIYAQDFVWQIARELYPDRAGGVSSIPAFNDHPATTHAHVIAVLDAALRRAQAMAWLEEFSCRIATRALSAPAQQLQSVSEALVGAPERRSECYRTL